MGTTKGTKKAKGLSKGKLQQICWDVLVPDSLRLLRSLRYSHSSCNYFGSCGSIGVTALHDGFRHGAGAVRTELRTH